MEYLIVAVILYFILQTAGNLVYILRGGTAKRPRSSPSHRWKGPSPRRETEGPTDRPRFWGKDIEEATWNEIKEEEAR